MDEPTDGGPEPLNDEPAFENAGRQFRVLIVHDRPANALQAMQMVEDMVGQLRQEFEIHRDFWGFEAIGQIGLYDKTVREALNADIVVVAADGDEELPAPVQNWLTRWAVQSGARAATLVALLRIPTAITPRSTLVRNFLRRLSDRTGVDLFAREFAVSPNKIHASPANPAPQAQRPSVLERGGVDQSRSSFRYPPLL